MSNKIKELLQKQENVRIIFDSSDARLFSGDTEVYTAVVDEHELLEQLRTEFKVFFAVTKSDYRRHVFTIRARGL